MRILCFPVVVFSAALPVLCQTQTYYNSVNVTGQFALSSTIDLMQTAQTRPALALGAFALRSLTRPIGASQETPRFYGRQLHPRLLKQPFELSPKGAVRAMAAKPVISNLAFIKAPPIEGFNGLTQLDQRNADNGNQFNVEPPNPSIAVANGFILEGVNNAIQVYDISGKALLPRVLATNEVFGIPVAINRVTGANGVFPTDMRVFFDPGIERWFVLQRAQDNDIAGNLLNSSHIYLAVSQTSDPTGTYNIYTADTTDASTPGCPCFSDYPQIGADQYGFYISANEFNTNSDNFAVAEVLALSKGSLASGAAEPRAYKFTMQLNTGYEFAIQPATTPPGASYFQGAGGLEYFVSTEAQNSEGSSVAIWAMSDTSALATGQSSPLLSEIIVPTLAYVWPDVAKQPDGPRPYGLSLTPPGALPFIDPGDTRALSLSYAGGRLYLTFSTSATDESGKNVVGGAYFVMSPTFRNGILQTQILRQNFFAVPGNHILRPSVAVDAHGRGTIAATVVGPNLFPSAAFIPVDTFSTPSTLHLAAAGKLPEDGFTGYPGGTVAGLARWGDYSTAVTANGGSVWSVVEYITNLPRAADANWDTFVMQSQ